MVEVKSYSNIRLEKAVVDIVAGIDRDVERGEDILMLGFGIVMMSSFFAILAPPTVLLPLVALTFAVSVTCARLNYVGIERKLSGVIIRLDNPGHTMLRPITQIFAENPVEPLAESFNPLKNWRRTGKSALGGLLINPLWIPVFYMMGLQIKEERNLMLLHRAVIAVEQRMALLSPEAA